eukprot:UN05354
MGSCFNIVNNPTKNEIANSTETEFIKHDSIDNAKKIKLAPFIYIVVTCYANAESLYIPDQLIELILKYYYRENKYIEILVHDSDNPKFQYFGTKTNKIQMPCSYQYMLDEYQCVNCKQFNIKSNGKILEYIESYIEYIDPYASTATSIARFYNNVNIYKCKKCQYFISHNVKNYIGGSGYGKFYCSPFSIENNWYYDYIPNDIDKLVSIYTNIGTLCHNCQQHTVSLKSKRYSPSQMAE